MIDCIDCKTAAEQMHHGFRANCLGCAARAASRGPNFRASKAKGQQTRAYREELRLLGVTHADVIAAASADKLDK